MDGKPGEVTLAQQKATGRGSAQHWLQRGVLSWAVGTARQYHPIGAQT